MRRQVPLINPDGRPLDQADWAATWTGLWTAMGSLTQSWRRPEQWAATTGFDRQQIAALLYAAGREGLVRRRSRVEHGAHADSRRFAHFARVDAVGRKLSDREFEAFEYGGWRWNYEMRNLGYLAPQQDRVVTPRMKADPDALNHGEAEVIRAFREAHPGGTGRRDEAWLMARDVPRSTFYASWNRLMSKGVLTRAAGGFQFVAPDQRR